MLQDIGQKVCKCVRDGGEFKGSRHIHGALSPPPSYMYIEK